MPNVWLLTFNWVFVLKSAHLWISNRHSWVCFLGSTKILAFVITPRSVQVTDHLTKLEVLESSAACEVWLGWVGAEFKVKPMVLLSTLKSCPTSLPSKDRCIAHLYQRFYLVLVVGRSLKKCRWTLMVFLPFTRLLFTFQHLSLVLVSCQNQQRLR